MLEPPRERLAGHDLFDDQASNPSRAIYIETIPFDETRDYVKKVMTNAVFYALLDGKQPSLTARIGMLPPKTPDERANKDLP